METNATDQTLLDAFRYVSGEMDEAERLRFEAALESDAAAQQALVDVVCLSEAVAIGTCDSIVANRQRTERCRSRRRVSVLASLAGCLALACLALLLAEHFEPQPMTQSVTPMATAADSEVVSLWSDLRSDIALTNPQPEVPELGIIDDAATSEFPAWMIAASLAVEEGETDERLLDDELDGETL